MHDHGHRSWLDHSNAQTLYHLEGQGRSSPGLVPFLGAGISIAYGLKDWKTLLLSAVPPRLKASVEAQLAAGDYEGAAETLLNDLGTDGFQNMVAAAAGDTNLDGFEFRSGTVALLPMLASGPVITTNFDRILERAFTAAGTPFESVIWGPRPDLIVDALHGNRRVLIKLHGDWQDRVGRTFAKSDYDENYGVAEPHRKRELLESAERLLFSSRSLLFIGSSLGVDRTVEMLQKVHKDYASIRHFAIMCAPASEQECEKKEKDLMECGVLPLWYYANSAAEHASGVEALIASIVERISVRTKAKPVDEAPAVRAVPIVRPPNAASIPAAGAMGRVVRLIEDGRLTFFLGSAIHSPTTLMAREFYKNLADIFECKAISEDRFAVAQYIADRFGRENLYSEIRKLFARTPLTPRPTHELFADWRSFKTSAGDQVPFPTVFTTNYDNVLETRLHEAGLPYHLLSYQADGPHRGLFYHRSPDNGLRIIERPRNIKAFSTGFVVVKLNGGTDRQGRIPVSYATTRLDYWDLAARIPDVLPSVVRDALSANPLLFLGHGMAAPDIESLVRFAHKRQPGPRSWAVVLGNVATEYWQQCGVTLLEQDVNDYVHELHAQLLANPATTTPDAGEGRNGGDLTHA